MTVVVAGLVAAGCSDDGERDGSVHGPIAPNITAPMGEAVPYATAEQLDTFERGREISLHRFSRDEGVGPTFNATFCTACHERPTTGGSAGLYRNFALAGATRDGAFSPADDKDAYPERSFPSVRQGVVRIYHYPGDALYSGEDDTIRPEMPDDLDVVAHRNAIPFFGVGLIAELPEEEILERADPDDEDGDGISGRPNYDSGFVGRFGLKAQTVSLVGFIRGPLFNHLGITTNPLTPDELASLPVDSSGGRDALGGDEVDMTPCHLRGDEDESARWLVPELLRRAQAAAPNGPLCDDDDAPDPEMTNQELFDIVSFAMLLAAPEFDELGEAGRRGQQLFDDIGCADCHAPRLDGPRGPIPVYSDLLLHDMGPELADGFAQKEAEGDEFRTQPLWGVAATGPYLHDGRATTLEDAILLHGGEAGPARDGFADLSQADRDAVVEFLLSLGGRDQYTPGLLPPGDEPPAAGEYGGPLRPLSPTEQDVFARGRRLFDADFGHVHGAGAPRFNGDSCRACHFEPVVGGAGPRGVNVLRHGILTESDEFATPAIGTSVLHRSSSILTSLNRPQEAAGIFEHRQTPHLFGLGLIERIPEETLLALADPDDSRISDGVTGRLSRTDGGRVGRFGWKAQVPSVREFVRDAVTTEMGMTVPFAEELTFGRIQDNDEVADPEMEPQQIELLTRYLQLLAPPPRQPTPYPALARRGQQVFGDVGCANCHIPTLETADGTRVELYSDLLLHEILPQEALGIEQASAGMREFRTAPLWGVSQSAPYLHSGAADTLDQAIRVHAGEATAAREAYLALPDTAREALLMFLETL